MLLKEFSNTEKPRERLMSKGSDALSNSELLAIILQTGTKEKNVLELSNYIINTIGFENLKDVSLTELRKIKGIGNAKACKILAFVELSKRINSYKNHYIKYIRSANDVFEILKEDIIGKKQEIVFLLTLDQKKQIISKTKVFVGTLNESIIHPREIFKIIVKDSASSFILVHNHPSGNLVPSESDKNITSQIKEISEMFSITFLDHVIISEKDYFSFKENKIIL